MIDTCGHATSNGRVGNPLFCADILDLPVISIESDVDGLSLFGRQFSQGLADFSQERVFHLTLFSLDEKVQWVGSIGGQRRRVAEVQGVCIPAPQATVMVDAGIEDHFSHVVIGLIWVGEVFVGFEQFDEGFLEDVIHARRVYQNIANKGSKNSLIFAPKLFQQCEKSFAETGMTDSEEKRETQRGLLTIGAVKSVVKESRVF